MFPGNLHLWFIIQIYVLCLVIAVINTPKNIQGMWSHVLLRISLSFIGIRTLFDQITRGYGYVSVLCKILGSHSRASYEFACPGTRPSGGGAAR